MRFTILLLIGLLLTACGGEGGASEDGSTIGADRDEAVQLVKDANLELKRIRVLYRENNQKVETLKTALAKKDIDTVKRLSDDLLLVINDGYAFAEAAQEKIEDAERLDINDDFKYYLSLKNESIGLQIKAFKFRSESAKLFRDKFGSKDKFAMEEAARKFRENEANFEKQMGEAKKVSERADNLFKEVNTRKR